MSGRFCLLFGSCLVRLLYWLTFIVLLLDAPRPSANIQQQQRSVFVRIVSSSVIREPEKGFRTWDFDRWMMARLLRRRLFALGQEGVTKRRKGLLFWEVGWELKCTQAEIVKCTEMDWQLHVSATYLHAVSHLHPLVVQRDHPPLSGIKPWSVPHACTVLTALPPRV